MWRAGQTGAIVAGMAALGLAGVQQRPPGVSPWGTDVRPLASGGERHWMPADGSGPGVLAGANHVISLQCADGGWGWPHETCPTTTFNSLTGPIAMGLLRAWEVTDDTAVLAAAAFGGDFDLTDTFPVGGEARFGSFTPAFLWLLSAATGDPLYGSHAETGYFDELTAGTYGDADDDTYGWIAALQAARSGPDINLRPWDLHNLPWVAAQIGNTDSTTPADGVPQSTTFQNALLDGLGTLEEGLQYDLLGLAGGIRGLALNGATSFAPIRAPLFGQIDGANDLCHLADVLAGFQNGDGSWSWRSDLQDPLDPTDKDTQTTSYAILALVAAGDACPPVPGGRYTTEIAAAREFLDSVQDLDGGFFSYPTGPHNVEVDAEALHAMAVAPLSLSTSPCGSSGTLTVTIDMAAMPVEIVGGQFFLEYEDDVLTFLDAGPGGGAFTVEVFESTAPGTIIYAVGVSDGGPGTSGPSTMATLTFGVDAEVCTPTAGLVSFDRDHLPPTRLTDAVGNSILPTLGDLNAVTLDGTDPLITPPSDIQVNADAGGCEALVSVAALAAMDACSGIASIVNDYTGSSDASGIYPAGTTTVTWTVTDDCGNESVALQDITVKPVNALILAIELQGVAEALVERCITLELYECPGALPTEIVELSLTFTAGLFAGTVEIPCSSYSCATARDALHTLRRTDLDDFGISGSAYVSDFTGSGGELIGGNLDDDPFIDILDFAIFVDRLGDVVGPDTPCPAPAGPHADISGDGIVFTEDFTFISVNFLEASETACCSLAPAHAVPSWSVTAAPGPVARIAVKALDRVGLEGLAVADLNRDGWLDARDMSAFAAGARP
jgi:hypothetical protein